VIWTDLAIAIVGGDAREQEITRCAVATGADVRCFGFPWPDGGIPGARPCDTAAEALAGADIALFPIPGISAEGALFAPASPRTIIPDAAMLGGMRAPAHIILGWADDNLRGHCEALGITLHEYEWDRDLMLLRGPAIVEGLLRALIEHTDITLHKARLCMVGHGTIGALATRTLIALGADVHVAARNPEQRAQAYAAGATPHPLTELTEILPTMDIVISSVPTRVIGRAQIESLPAHALLVDVAGPPGGIDREAAQDLGRTFVWARGLGSRAPVTVGRSQWGGIRRRIETICEERS